MNRRNFIQTLAAAPAILSGQTRRPPNIVFILADDMGYGDLGCYGQTRIATPNIDRLAGEGIRFTQAYAGATVCAPSRCCLMTGKHTGHSTVRGNKKPEVGIRPDELTIPAALKQRGYSTALYGKWGLGGPGTGSLPTRRGFDDFYGYLDQQHAHTAFPEHIWNKENEVMLTANWFYQRQQFAPDLFAEKTYEFLDQPRQNPFFLYFPTIIPHANNELGRLKPNGMESPDLGQYASKDWPEQEKTFAAAITRLDGYVGKILDLLDKHNQAENTLVVFSSDNGPHAEGNHKSGFFESSGPLRGIKRDLHDGGIRVPMITRWKGTIKSGQTSDATFAFWDFLPSFAALAGASAPKGIDGINVVPTITEGKQVEHDHFYWEFHEGGFAQAVRKGNWKLVKQRPSFVSELYDISKDVGEKNNIASQHPQVVAELEKLFKTSRTDSAEFPVKAS